MKNIEINYMNESGYEILYPKTTTENLIDFGEVLYTKEEVDGFIAGLSNQINEQTGNLRFAYGTYTGQYRDMPIDLGDGVMASNWVNVSLEFQPIGIIISQANHFSNVGPYAPYSTGPMGFALPWQVYNHNMIEGNNSGFRVRNIGTSYVSVAPNLVFLNYIYAYFAFG